MRREILQEIEIPKDIEISIEGDIVKAKGAEGENKREFNLREIDLEKKDNKILIGNKKATKNEKKRINTITAHIKNLIKGAQKKFEYQLKVASGHFPMTVEIQGKIVTIKNFFGEKNPRTCKIPEGAEVKLDGDILTVTSIDKEIAGQAAANLERSTKIRAKDRRIFQDGIYIINKAGKEI